jgi:hypothetical protein
MPGEKKYAKCIIDKTINGPVEPRPADPAAVGGTNVLWINDELQGAVPGASYLNIALITKPFGFYESHHQGHVHSFDEYVTFIGTNAEKPDELDGLVEMWLEDEKYMLTKNTAVFCPRGVYHCPVVFHEVNSPIVWIASAPTVLHYTYPRDPIDPPPAGYGVV